MQGDSSTLHLLCNLFLLLLIYQLHLRSSDVRSLRVGMPAVTGSPGEEEEQAWLNVRAPWLGARRGDSPPVGPRAGQRLLLTLLPEYSLCAAFSEEPSCSAVI